MNIFVTDLCPIKSAINMCDVHLNKMIVETAQLLSTAHIIIDGTEAPYKKTHVNHPSAVWVRESASNYEWAYQHLVAMCGEYVRRKGYAHATSEHVLWLGITPRKLRDRGLTPFALAMPDEFKSKDVVKSYRNYLRAKFQEWRSRDKPVAVTWFNAQTPLWAGG